jgi:hypothetical protein
MKSSSRLLLAFGVAVGVLVIVAVVLVLTMPAQEVRLFPEDTPEGTVQRYFLALQAQDYLKAYNYLSPPPSEKIAYEDWRGPAVSSEEKPELKVTLGKSVVTGNEATVDSVVDVFRPSGPFGNPVHTHHITFSLKQEGTSWKITSPADVWWLFY